MNFTALVLLLFIAMLRAAASSLIQEVTADGKNSARRASYEPP